MRAVHPDGLPELFLDRSFGRQQVWVVLMKDDRIRYRPVERAAVLDHQVRAFCPSSGNLRAAEMAQRFIGVLDQITEACSQPGPFLHAANETITSSSTRHTETAPI
jgi:hypothetical protein